MTEGDAPMECDLTAPVAPQAPSVKLARILAVPVLEQRSPAWFAKRLTRITSSEASAVLGENPYETADDVFFRKRGLGKPFTGNVATRYGQENEPVAIEAYCAALGRTSIDVGLIDHEAIHGANPEMCFMAGSPDGVTMLAALGDQDPEPIMLEARHDLLFVFIARNNWPRQTEPRSGKMPLPTAHRARYRAAPLLRASATQHADLRPEPLRLRRV